MTTTTTVTMTKADLLARKPDWAKAAIVATYEADKSDSMTDYFATSTERVVFLAWSKHTKDLFPEMRKAALLLPETAHLGPGKDVYTARIVFANDVVESGTRAYGKGSYSHWHSDVYGEAFYGNHAPTFETLAAAEAYVASKGTPDEISFGGTIGTFEWKISKSSIEHREKYSMGAGYYLKASGRYSSGWTVEKTSLGYGLRDVMDVAVGAVPAAA